MADDEQLEQVAEGGGGKGGGLIRTLGVVLGIVLVGATAALLLFVFVLRPMMQPPEIPNEDEEEPRLDPIPMTAVTFNFPETYASVEMPSPDMPASTLLYQVSVECSDAVALQLVEAHQARFIDMLGELHRNRTREEWNDPLVVEGVKKQALRKANEILKRLQAEPDSNVRITAVFYKQFYVSDL